MKKTVLLLLSFLCIALLSCSGDTPPAENEVAYINIQTPNVTLFVGQTYQVAATTFPADAINTDISWSTSNDDICRVDANGRLEAVGSGNCVVRASCSGGAFAMVTVRILAPSQIDTIYLSQTTLSLTEGDTYSLEAFSTPSSFVANPPVIWKSTNPDVATVDSNGSVTAITSGSCLIVAECDDRLRAACALSVLEAPEDTPVFDLSDLVALEVRGLPQILEYNNYETGDVITRVEITSYEVERSMYDEDGVKVTVTFKGKKLYDCDGEAADNPIRVTMSLFGEEDKHLADWLLVLEHRYPMGDEPEESGKKMGEDFELIFEFEAIIAIEQRQFYITLSDA